ncbi:hypothetical protein [Methylobacterium sp. WL120]|uniref:hypothetical protein n=1 Tax=Methylobacterium sp. WL120 TaxID=2603887 RepID=UPI0011CAE7B9|nr:hypothetical protein [Methylobacterium sp. WL120]TXM69654.1 hypothetical protein FV229_04735 [Methylobacterium sp. WL120]
MRNGSVRFTGEVEFGAWGRHGRILQSGLYATILGDNIVLEPITSKGAVSTAASIRIPLADRAAVIKLLRDLS